MYIATLKPIFGNHTYHIRIDTVNNNEIENEIELGVEPLSITYEGGELIYKPVKLSSATLSLVSNSYLFDLYAAKAQDNLIKITDESNNIIWIGYVTPNLYNQSYQNDTEEFKIECIDALATLQYINYTSENLENNIVSFESIIKRAINIASSNYSKLIVSNSFDKGLSDLFISESNFYDELNEPMKWLEVIEQIAQYLGMTIIAYGDSIYMLDYDAIIKDINNYTQYNLSDNTISLITLSDIQTINKNNIMSNDATLSLDNVYNKVKIIASLYPINYLFTALNDENLTATYSNNYERMYQSDLSTYNKLHFYKGYNSDNIVITNNNYLSMTQFANYCVGGSGANTIVDYTNSDYNITGEINIPFDRYILFGLPLGINDSNYISYKINSDCVSFKQKFYLQLKGSALWATYMKKYENNNIYYRYYPIINIEDEYNKDRGYCDNLKIPCKIRLYDSSNNYTDIPFDWKFENLSEDVYNAVDNKGWYYKHFINKWFNSQQTNNNNGLEGSILEIDGRNNVSNIVSVELLIYSPSQPNSNYQIPYVWLKDFSVTILDSLNINDENKSDMVYENIINSDFISEWSDLDYKINTYPDKGIYKSTVVDSNGNNISTVTAYSEKSQIFEKHIIEKLVNQYSTPSKILNITLSNTIKPYSKLTHNFLPNSEFVVDTMSIDLSLETNTLKIVEKNVIQ